MIRNIILLIFLIVVVFLMKSCGPIGEEDDGDSAKVVYVACDLAAEQAGICTRFMDRDLYFAYTSGDRNNAFHKQIVQEALEELACSTTLGCNYFTFHDIDESLLETPTEAYGATSFKSHVQIWPDDEFNDFYVQFGVLPDSNAILMLNSANKRQFYLIIRASCFSGDVNCTNDAGADFTSNKGMHALVYRQFGLMVGMLIEDGCLTWPDDANVMCEAYPHDGQFVEVERLRFINNFNNSLETISNNPTFYEYFYIEE